MLACLAAFRPMGRAPRAAPTCDSSPWSTCRKPEVLPALPAPAAPAAAAAAPKGRGKKKGARAAAAGHEAAAAVAVPALPAAAGAVPDSQHLMQVIYQLQSQLRAMHQMGAGAAAAPQPLALHPPPMLPIEVRAAWSASSPKLVCA